MLREFDIVCGGTAEDETLSLIVNSAVHSLQLKVDALSKDLVTNIPPLLIDFIEVAAYVYAADSAAGRGGPAESMGGMWRRNFRYDVPVRDLESWTRAGVATQLAHMLNFLSDDNHEFQFRR